MKKIFTICLLALTTSFYSQNTSETNAWILHVGGVFPSSDFGDDKLEGNSMGASIGLGLNLEYLYPINDNGLNLLFGLGFNYNGLQNDVKDDIEDLYSNNGLDGDIDYPNYFTAPLTAGINYTFSIDNSLALYGNFSLLYNFIYMTDEVYEDSSTEITVSSDVAGNFGYKLGGGVRLKKNTYISLNLLNAGDTEIERNGEGTSDSVDLVEQRFEFEPNIQYLTLTVGFRL